jgi:MarR family transcriptional regulator, lower aerobic nicotinate degradation pathway regulator
MGAKVYPQRAGEGLDGVRETLDGVRRLVRALRLSNREAERRVGLSAAQLFVLQCVGDSHALSLGEVAARTATDQSSVSVVVSRLVGQGLLSRRRSRDDGRRLEISLTARGRRLLRRSPDVVQHRLVGAVRELPGAERRRLARVLDRLVHAMGHGERVPTMFFEGEGPAARKRAARG